ncbi:MAG: 50S ribosomal protein L11 methyltransferase [Rikenellaceae bacterium]|nr:50S ribosomal protein L11 methyltransferase [Rikenellaceae bacterium]
MNYIEFTVDMPPNGDENCSEILIADLADLGFESFTEEDGKVKGYVTEADYGLYEIMIDNYLADTGYKYDKKYIENSTNWNAQWESNFHPIDVDGRCYIRAPFHEEAAGYEYIVTIMPKMSFGTGHHATTHLMIEAILDSDLADCTVLNMGSGTGVLAILAIMAGADSVDAIDIDEWAYENCRENAEINDASDRINIMLGDASLLKEPRKYDFIFANINRNILLADMGKYADSLKPEGGLFMSGFLDIDSGKISDKAINLGLKPTDKNLRDGWCMMKFIKVK